MDLTLQSLGPLWRYNITSLPRVDPLQAHSTRTARQAEELARHSSVERMKVPWLQWVRPEKEPGARSQQPGGAKRSKVVETRSAESIEALRTRKPGKARRPRRSQDEPKLKRSKVLAQASLFHLRHENIRLR